MDFVISILAYVSPIAAVVHVLGSVIRLGLIKNYRTEYARRILRYIAMVALYFLVLFLENVIHIDELFNIDFSVYKWLSEIYLFGLSWCIGFYYLRTIFHRKKFESIFH